MRTITYNEWLAEARAKFGDDPMQWRFKCPSCCHVASVQNWKDAGATEGEVAFSCIGRRTGANDNHTFQRKGGPCNYAGGGLLRLNPVHVQLEDGIRETFEFAEAQKISEGGT